MKLEMAAVKEKASCLYGCTDPLLGEHISLELKAAGYSPLSTELESLTHTLNILARRGIKELEISDSSVLQKLGLEYCVWHSGIFPNLLDGFSL